MLLYYKFFMPDGDGGAGGGAMPAGGGGPAPEPAPAPAPEAVPDGLPPNDPDGEGTTPEEVAAALKGSGINLPDEPKPKDDEEEGDDPDKPKPGDEADPDKPADETDEEREAREAEEAEAAEKEKQEKEEAEAAEKKRKEDEAAVGDDAVDDRYSFEVEDANGVTFKITVGATMEKIMAEFEPKNNGQILDILDQLRDLKDQKAKDETKLAEDNAKIETTERVNKIRAGWDAEVTDLTAQKRIPEGEDGEKRVAEVYAFMNKENDKRIKDDKPTLSSFEDALDKMEAQEAREAKEKAEKDKKEDARKNGNLVGGSSSPATSPAPVYVAGSAKNANEAIRKMGLLK